MVIEGVRTPEGGQVVPTSRTFKPGLAVCLAACLLGSGCGGSGGDPVSTNSTPDIPGVDNPGTGAPPASSRAPGSSTATGPETAPSSSKSPRSQVRNSKPPSPEIPGVSGVPSQHWTSGPLTGAVAAEAGALLPLAADGDGAARERVDELRALPDDTCAAISALSSYDWRSAEGRARYLVAARLPCRSGSSIGSPSPTPSELPPAASESPSGSPSG